jgi:hypothetical protein
MRSRLPFALSAITSGVWLASQLCACSGDQSNDRDSDTPAAAGGNGGASGSSMSGSGAQAGAGPAFSNPDGGVVGGGHKPVPTGAPDGGECGATSMTADQVIVETQMEVTEEVSSVEPVAIYIMLDQSASMIPLWADAIAGIKAFVTDAKSNGTDVALDFFPSFLGETGDCDGTGYDQPYIALGRLPMHAPEVTMELDNVPLPTGAGTPLEGALNGLARFCAQFQQTSMGEKCVGVLVTDGEPVGCSGDTAALVDIATQAHANGVATYAVGLTGSDFTFLDQIAMQGGAEDCDATADTYACDVTAGAALLVNALAKIRDTVTTTTTHTVTNTMTVETPLPCEWAIPETPPMQLSIRKR